MSQTLKILIVDDHPIFRHGLAAVIGKNARFKIAGDFDDGESALAAIDGIAPDIVIMDIDMPKLDGIETARLIRKRGIAAKIIFLTMHRDRNFLKAMESIGVNGYVLKDAAMYEIVNCIERVERGMTYLSPAIIELAKESKEAVADPNALENFKTLTKAERKVLHLISESRTTREIAEQLFISARTVETHRYNISSKLNLTGTHALFKFAVSNKAVIASLFDSE